MTQTRLRVGGHTDVGQVRQRNDDSLLLGPEVYVVADGMGGHQGGDVASRIAIETLAETFEPTSLDSLVTSIQTANERIVETAQADPSLLGMGTTVIAITVVVVDGEERLAIANVGDSRGYLFQQGDLRQITHDHSLVAGLVREGRITEAEAEVHPQRNIITRALGIDDEVVVDDFQLLPFTGDRYLLCSDGLTNEVPTDEIARILRTVDDPTAAAETLVSMANDHGGRDNITVVIVDVVDDGGRAEEASALVANTAESRLLVPLDEDDDTDTSDPTIDHTQPDTERLEIVPEELARAPRAVTLRSVGFAVVVLALIGVAAAAVSFYARNTYAIDTGGDRIEILQGRDLWWFSQTSATVVDRDPADLTDADREQLERRSFSSIDSAVAFVDEKYASLPTTTTTTTTTTTVPPSTVSSTTTSIP